MPHSCHATDCRVEVEPKLFMCKRHWFMLPLWLRHLIWRTYRPGQCDDKKPSKDYCKAAKRAVIEVATQERKTPDTQLYDYFLAHAE